MPKKKTGQRKKAEKQKIRQKEIRAARDNLELPKYPCNAVMKSLQLCLKIVDPNRLFYLQDYFPVN